MSVSSLTTKIFTLDMKFDSWGRVNFHSSPLKKEVATEMNPLLREISASRLNRRKRRMFHATTIFNETISDGSPKIKRTNRNSPLSHSREGDGSSGNKCVSPTSPKKSDEQAEQVSLLDEEDSESANPHEGHYKGTEIQVASVTYRTAEHVDGSADGANIFLNHEQRSESEEFARVDAPQQPGFLSDIPRPTNVRVRVSSTEASSSTPLSSSSGVVERRTSGGSERLFTSRYLDFHQSRVRL